MSGQDRQAESGVLEPSGAGAATIFALSSGQGRAGVAVIRVSGSRARRCVELLCRQVPEPRFATLTSLRDPKSGSLLDQALVLWFPGPSSFTGEDVAEFHIHGGRAVIAAMLEVLGGMDGLRLAEPGEFAKRAFENGKLDLTSAEGLADLVNAETECQRAQALRQAGGAQKALLESWREELVSALSLAEASIDFSDEADVSEDLMSQTRKMTDALHREIGRHLADGHRGEIIRDGFRVVIMGAPNAGKSSLLNALARRDVAIVSTEAGTTRDVIEVALDLGGVQVLLSDTAGIRETSGAIEQEGIKRALTQASHAQLILWLDDASQPTLPVPEEIADAGSCLLRVSNKCDLVRVPSDEIAISAKTGQGLSALEARLGEMAQAKTSGEESPLITRARHRQELAAAHIALGEFLAGSSEDWELRAEDLRLAARALGRITGQVDVEEVLGRVFAEFCIGK